MRFLLFMVKGFGPTLNPEARGPPPVICPRLIIIIIIIIIILYIP
jgi:hypothetical protein